VSRALGAKPPRNQQQTETTVAVMDWTGNLAVESILEMEAGTILQFLRSGSHCSPDASADLGPKNLLGW
jgi:hypothetical protein